MTRSILGKVQREINCAYQSSYIKELRKNVNYSDP
jgi:hypothetical protein